MMFLFFLFVLQLGAATSGDDDFHGKGGIVQTTTTSSWSEIVKPALFGHGGERRLICQDVVKAREPVAASVWDLAEWYLNRAKLIHTEYGKCPDDMDGGNWLTFYRKHPKQSPGLMEGLAEQLELENIVRRKYGKQPCDMTAPEWRRFQRHHKKAFPTLVEYDLGGRAASVWDLSEWYLKRATLIYQEYGKGPGDMGIGAWFKFYNKYPEQDPGQIEGLAPQLELAKIVHREHGRQLCNMTVPEWREFQRNHKKDTLQ